MKLIYFPSLVYWLFFSTSLSAGVLGTAMKHYSMGKTLPKSAVSIINEIECLEHHKKKFTGENLVKMGYKLCKTKLHKENYTLMGTDSEDIDISNFHKELYDAQRNLYKIFSIDRKPERFFDIAMTNMNIGACFAQKARAFRDYLSKFLVLKSPMHIISYDIEQYNKTQRQYVRTPLPVQTIQEIIRRSELIDFNAENLMRQLKSHGLIEDDTYDANKIVSDAIFDVAQGNFTLQDVRLEVLQKLNPEDLPRLDALIRVVLEDYPSIKPWYKG